MGICLGLAIRVALFHHVGTVAADHSRVVLKAVFAQILQKRLQIFHPCDRNATIHRKGGNQVEPDQPKIHDHQTFNKWTCRYSQAGKRLKRTRCDQIAEGIISAVREVGVEVPVVVRLEGTKVDEGRQLLADSGLAIIPAADLNDAARKVVAAARGEAAGEIS